MRCSNIVETVLFGMRGSAGKAWRSPPENWGSSTEPDIAELWNYNEQEFSSIYESARHTSSQSLEAEGGS